MEKVEPVKKETEPVKGIEPEAVEQEHADAEVAIKADNAQKLSVQEGAEATEAEDAKAREEAKEAEVGEAPPAPKLHVACTVGVERQLQVLLPDRPLDLQFSVTDSRTLDTEHIPGPLKRYLDDLNAFISEGGDRTRPITPVMVKHDGRTYVVHSSQSVGRSTVPLTHRVFSTDTIHASALEEPASASEGAPSGIKDTPTATKERVLDLEGGERTNICRVEVPVGESDAEWETFLRTCDRLTCPALPEQAPKAKLDFAGSSVTDGAGKEAEGESS
uniref:Expressed protein n=1 Tax=Schizophyllum commune (strain H4-8 / FGSC 9210) TaxID=578458 RepID=D8PKQ8_SCHCM